jgi:hypothetical protein
MQGIGDCGDGSDPAYDACCATAAGCGSTTGSGETPTETTGGSAGTANNSSGETSTEVYTDINGNSCTFAQYDWNNMLCPSSPGYNPASPGVGTGTAAQIAAALAASAAAAAKALAAQGTHINCGNGTTAPVGSACAGAAVGQVCPTGMTLSGTTCVTGLFGMSTTTLLLIGVVLFAFMAESGGKRR